MPFSYKLSYKGQIYISLSEPIRSKALIRNSSTGQELLVPVSSRQEQGEIAQLQAKQGWVSSSAKLALLAPWLVAVVLVQLPQNRAAFATELGAAVLILGLVLSLFAYALVNRLGRLPLPGRVLDGIS